MSFKRQVNNRTQLYPQNIEDRYLIDRHQNTPLFIQPTGMNFKGSEPRCCSVFGCGRILSIEELRFGNKCICHG